MEDIELALQCFHRERDEFNTRFNYSLIIYSALLVSLTAVPQIFWWGIASFGIILLIIMRGYLLRNWRWIHLFYGRLIAIHTEKKKGKYCDLYKGTEYQNGRIFPDPKITIPGYEEYTTKNFLDYFTIAFSFIWIIIAILSIWQISLMMLV